MTKLKEAIASRGNSVCKEEGCPEWGGSAELWPGVVGYKGRKQGSQSSGRESGLYLRGSEALEQTDQVPALTLLIGPARLSTAEMTGHRD